jgi:hypothetical protein
MTATHPLADVIPIRSARQIEPTTATPLPPDPPDATEPAQLYDRIIFVLTVHRHGDVVATVDGSRDFELCQMCQKPWPCNKVRLAFRQREGF